MEMSDIMKTLFLVASVNIFSAFSRSPSDCVGSWRPVFKPSQAEPSDNDVHGFTVHGKSLRSDDRNVDHEITHVFVPVTKPNAYRLEHKLTEVNQPGYDTSVQDVVSRGKHTLQWDHYGDVSKHYVQNKENYRNNQDRLPDANHYDGYVTNNDTQHADEHYGKGDGGPEGNADDEKFFNSGSFFDEHTEDPLRDLDDFSKEDFHESGPSSEYNRENVPNDEGGHDEDFAPEKRPTYPSVSSVYNSYNNEPQPHEYKDHSSNLRHESYPYKSIWTHYQGPAEYLPNVEDNGDYYVDYGTQSDHNNNGVHSSHVYNNIPPSDPNRPIKQYSVHETPEEQRVEPSISNQPINILYSKPVLNEHMLHNFWRKDSGSVEELRPPPESRFPSMLTSLFYKKNPRTINHRVFNNKRNVRKPFSYVYVLKTMNTNAQKRL